jgi:hypothetical protein
MQDKAKQPATYAAMSMEDKIRSNTSKAYYKQKKAQLLKRPCGSESPTKAGPSKLDIQQQLLIEKCKKLDLPEFLAPYIKINKHSVAFIAPSRNELLELCMLIVDNAELVESYFSLMQDSLRNAANYRP